jgi:hypothetical protein
MFRKRLSPIVIAILVGLGCVGNSAASAGDRERAMALSLDVEEARRRREELIKETMRRMAADSEGRTIPATAGEAAAPARPVSSGVQVTLDGEPMRLRRPVLVEDSTPLVPLKDVAAALGYTVLALEPSTVRLIAPDGRSQDVTPDSSDPSLLATTEELKEWFELRARYDAAQRLVVLETVGPAGFQTYSVPKPEEQLRAAAAFEQRAAEALAAREAPPSPENIPAEARPDVELTNRVSYSYDNPHTGPPFRVLTTTTRGHVGDFDVAYESVRKDQSGIFQHDYTYLNLSRPNLFIGAFDQRTDLHPLRGQFEDFNGVQVRKAWGDPSSSGRGTLWRYRPLEPPRDERSATTLAWGLTEQAVSGTEGSVTYLGQLYEARQEFAPADWLRLKGALYYLQHDADLGHLSGTSGFPRNNLVSFGDVALTLPYDVKVSGQLARSDYRRDDDPDGGVGDWDYRTAIDWERERYRMRFSYEFVGDDYASLGNPAVYQDYEGATFYNYFRVTDGWSLSGSFSRFRDNVDHHPDILTTQNQLASVSSSHRLSDTQTVSFNAGRTMVDSDGPNAGSSSRGASYGVDYFSPFLFQTRLLSSYQYSRTEATTASDTISHGLGLSLFKSFARGSSWFLSERVRRTARELEDDSLGLSTTLNLNLQPTRQLSTYVNSSYNRDLVDNAEHADAISGALGFRYEVEQGTTVGAEYAIDSYDLDRERGEFPQEWSILFLVTKEFGFSTAPNFGTIEGVVFQDLNGDGFADAGEPRVPDAAVRLKDGKRTLTDAQGRFAFLHRIPGSEELQLDLSNVDPDWASPETDRAILVKKQRVTRADFPLVQASSIAGAVFIDENGDGVFQDAEEPLEGVVVILLPSGDSRATNADGTFQFTHLLPGRYTVLLHLEDVPKGYQPAADQESRDVAVQAGEAKTRVDFAVRLASPPTQF